MKTEIKKLLLDVQNSINSIEEYLGVDKNYFEYSTNKMMRRAIEREFEIIGEALNKIDKYDSHFDIEHKKQIIALRNRVIHNYDKIDDEIIWGIIIKYLPLLKIAINNLL